MMEFPIIQEESDDERLARMARFIGLEEMFPASQLSGVNVQERLVHAKIRVVELRVRTICEEYSNSTGIEISPNARELIRLIHTAILADSHSTWSGNRFQAADQYLSALDSTLGDIVRDEKIQDRITTFDILHWISKDKDLARICIIQKTSK
jgi:hypothetical protein